MSAFTAIDLSKLQPPQIVETPDFEKILADMKAQLIAKVPEIAAIMALESEALVKAFEVFAYREMILRARINDAAKGVMLAFAERADLDHLAVLFGITRQIVQTADATVTPPRAEILEDDERLRRRTQLALEGSTSAGSKGAYISHGLSADARIKDIGVFNPEAGVVQISVLSNNADGAADAALIGIVNAALNDEDVRPLTDDVQVQSAQIIDYSINAILTLYDGPDADFVLDKAREAARLYANAHHVLGHDITVSALHAALHQAGVQNVNLISPPADIVIAAHQAAYCTGIQVSIGGRNA
jgi:phage-related baseplate assembly protein